jgi:YidC/Oxa1 family membrane protein insertase
MDRNSVIGLLLIGAIMVVFTMVNQPDREALEKQKQEQITKDSLESIQKAASAEIDLKADSLKINGQPTNQFVSTSPTEEQPEIKAEKFYLENESVKITFSSRGGIPEQFELKDYKTWQKKPLELFLPDSSLFSFNLLNSSNKALETSSLAFVLDQQSNQNKLILKAYSDSIHFISFNYELLKGYNISFTADFTNAGELFRNSNTSLPVNIRFAGKRQEKNVENERNNTTIYYRDIKENEVDKVSPLESASEKVENSLEWLAFKEQFFALALISNKEIQPGATLQTVASTSDSLTKSMHASFVVPIEPKSPTVSFTMFVGPTQYHLLKEQGHDLQDLVPLGWGIFGWVNKLIVIPAFKFLGNFNLGYGLVILILTIYIKLILLAFQYRSYLSQAKMRVLKPEIDEINAKYADGDAMQKQQAVMGLYREAGVNPLGGCLPMLFQIPVLFALFSFFPAAIELRQQGFLWADDLSTYDSIMNLPFTIPFYGNHISLFALLMTVSTIIYTRMNNQLSAGSTEMMAGLKWMMYLMPVIFLFVLNSYAAGLNYYYFLANVITFGQQFAFRKLVDDKKIHAKIQEKKKQPKKAAKTSFQQKLEEMAKARQSGKK